MRQISGAYQAQEGRPFALPDYHVGAMAVDGQRERFLDEPSNLFDRAVSEHDFGISEKQ